LVYPSFFEGFGLPPLEAAAVGCPTIISDNTATAETMGNAALQVSPYDIKQIALAMKAIAIDRQLAVRCKMRGFERVAWYSKVRQSTALFSALDYASQLI
ncbi:MAG: glycosyltransferase, partial [Candidatus Magasanikbacteria bacterium]|nr:glycosyltransferase [Candidatus Magasanikbacteria bacterium]